MGKANKVTDLVLMIHNITEYDGVKVFHLKGYCRIKNNKDYERI